MTPRLPAPGAQGLLVAMLALQSCAGPPLTLDLMPAPDLYSDAGYDPFGDQTPINTLPDFDLFYATLRDPAGEGDEERFYTNRRGNVLRVGRAHVKAGNKDFTWEEARRVSLAKNRTDRYPIGVTSVQEIGILESSVFAPAEVQAGEQAAQAAFAKAVGESLERSKVKDVYVYVHGYKVVFENPVLVAAELWHFLGYQGVMVAFSWPSTPSRLAYFADAETAIQSARGLRRFLAILADQPAVERIHVIAYSAGTRVLSEALNQVSLIHHGESHDQILARRKIGHVMLIASDVDRQTMGAYVQDGLLRVPEHLTAYLSDADEALQMSQWVMRGRVRMGESWNSGGPAPEAIAYLNTVENLTLVDVSNAAEYDAGSGHAYFRRSPWVSSDMLLTLARGLTPTDRCLVQDEDSPCWRFPPDYVERLRILLADLNILGSAEASVPEETGTLQDR